MMKKVRRSVLSIWRAASNPVSHAANHLLKKSGAPAGRLCMTVLLAAGVPALAAQRQAACKVDPHAPVTRLTGTVTDQSHGVVIGANVTLVCGGYRQQTQTTAEGSYSISVPEGSYTLEVRSPGYAPIQQAVSLDKAGLQQKNLMLQMGTAVSIVSVTAPSGYVATSSTTATKTGLPLIETPQTISVITGDQLVQRDVQSMNQALDYTAGVGTATYGADPRFDWFNIRGFDESTYGMYRDNLRWQSGQVEGEIEPFDLQEIDVIKGPSSVLYGQNTPGGLVNLVTKRPEAYPSNEIIAQFGSFDRKQVQADLGGPLDVHAHFRYRLVGLYRNSGTQVNYVPDDRDFIAPSFTWAPSDKTTLTILTDYQHDNSGWSQFLPAQGTLEYNPNGKIPTDTFTGQPGFDYFHRQQWSLAYLFEHHFSKIWTFRQAFRYSRIAFDGDDAFGGGLAPDLKTLYRFGYSDALTLGLYAVDNQAFAQFKTGKIQQSVLAGLDYSHADSLQISGFSSAPSIDIYNPDYNQKIAAPVPYLKSKQPSWQNGVYLQDLIKFTPKIITTLSGREDWTGLKTEDLLFGTPTTKQNPSRFTGRAGATYLSSIGLAPYFSYSTSFLPTTGVNFYGQPYKPTTGKEYEGGLKYQPVHTNSFITASFYNIVENNVQEPDPNNPNNTVQTGAVRSRGVELEAVANVMHGLDLHASYAYDDEKVTKAEPASEIGKRPTLIPQDLISLDTHYTFSSGPLTGLGLGGGVRYTGTVAGDADNTFILPGYTLFDASMQYDWKSLEFQVTGTNVGDKIFVPICTSISYCNYGGRRNIIGNMQYHWGSWRHMF
jgi:iron complex outermembrane receptor protein